MVFESGKEKLQTNRRKTVEKSSVQERTVSGIVSRVLWTTSDVDNYIQ